jgi:hypothetical protein
MYRMLLVHRLNNGFTTGYLLGDVFGFLRPDKGLWVLAAKPDVLFDGGYQLRNTSEYHPANPFPCDLSEPSFYRIQPR